MQSIKPRHTPRFQEISLLALQFPIPQSFFPTLLKSAHAEVGNRQNRREENRAERENDLQQQQHAEYNKNSKQQDNKLKKKRTIMLSRAVQ
jgi:hypothetical protein